ncbi:Triosephosphate isomerase [Rhynchospora pubera]|uniref:Triosephosphate isomerase n=1 Tax=Rhynchospora pubera TaxID=906938 RepID=A0AAV8G7C6_9POAL|nr:Triosephosphate isomerase [Rhynchospora pubera]KAJ4801604.1 Triosephosphate isomerase [Rhynchospora pubera]
MAKNRNKKKSTNQGVAPMDTSSQAFVSLTPPDEPQPMDTSEGKATNLGASSINRKINKGMQVRRTKSLRKKKSVARAISISEKNEEKVVRMKNKKIRIQSAKTLYE